MTAGPSPYVRLALALSAMAVVLSFQLTSGVDALIGELTIPGSSPGAMTDLTGLGRDGASDWVAARETWDHWALVDCQMSTTGRCLGRAAATGEDLARTFLR